MATKIGDLYFNVSADTSAVNRAIAGIGLAATAAAAIIATELVSAGVKFNTEIQRTTALFSALTGSVEVARDTMREFAGLSLDSPIFDAKTLARAAQLLLTFDVAQKYVGELAENITLASVALGKGTQGATQLARAIGQIQGRGWLEGDEARQLSEVGINAYAVIAEAIGKTTGEVMELGRQNLLLAEDVIPILNDHLRETFGEVAPQLLNTFGVQVQGLGNIFKALGSAIVEPFIGSFSGGALTTAIGDIREGLRGLVTEGEDGLFELAGALEPFNDLFQSMADSVGRVAEKFSGWLSGATAGDSLEGVVAGLSVFGSEVSDALSGAVDLVQDVFASLQPVFPAIGMFLGSLYELARDALPIVADGIRELADIIGIIAPDVLKAGAAFVVVFGPVLLATLNATVLAIGLVADVLEIIDGVAPVAAVAIGLLTTALIAFNAQAAIASGIGGANVLRSVFVSLSFQASAAGAALAGVTPRLAAFATTVSRLAGPLALAATAVGAWTAAMRGAQGDIDWLYREVSLLEKPFQALARGVYELFGGTKQFETWSREVAEASSALFAELSAGSPTFEEFSTRADEMRQSLLELAAQYEQLPSGDIRSGLLDGIDQQLTALNQVEIDSVREEVDRLLPALQQGIDTLEEFDILLSGLSLDPGLKEALRTEFADFLLNEEELARARAMVEVIDAINSLIADAPTGTGGWLGVMHEMKDLLDDFAAREVKPIRLSSGQIIEIPIDMIKDATDLIKVLETVADDAAQSLAELLTPPPGASIDTFLQSLIGLATDVTEAMQSPAGVLADLDFRVAEESVRQQARELVSALVDEYGLSLKEIEDLLNDQGLAGVIEALGLVTEQTTDTVDPLIAKYGELGASADLIREAISKLEDQRTTRLRAQIDQVQAALRDATAAADEARKAFDEFFLGGTGGLQGAIDKLVLDVPGIGDDIEEGLLRGGPQGEAMVRQALGQAGQSLGSIFQLGLEQGLSPEEIITLLEPVYGSISQELGEALNRISTLDWTSGFTPAAAAEIQGWFAGILDPAQIGALFAGITGADSQVAGLQAQLDALQAEMQLDVEFSPEQVQAAIDEIQAEVATTAIITPEAAQAVYDAIQDVLDSDELLTSIDKKNTTQQIVDAAKDAENQITLDLNSQLVFDPVALDAMAQIVGAEFAEIFRTQMIMSLGGVISPEGVPNPGAGPTLEDFINRGVQLGIISPEAGTQVLIDNDITINESGSPRQTASEVVAASSAAAGSGGRYDPSRYSGYRPIQGPR